MLAQTVWGEARGCSRMEQAAVIWCVLNRVDNGWGSIEEVISKPSQFDGYNEENPILEEFIELVLDVLDRWTRGTDEGRVLPSDYMWFTGDGVHNYFVNEWKSEDYWDWSLPNPYED